MLASVVFVNIVKSFGQKGKCVAAEMRTHVLFQKDRRSGIHDVQSATGTVLLLSQFQSASADRKLIVAYYSNQKFLILI